MLKNVLCQQCSIHHTAKLDKVREAPSVAAIAEIVENREKVAKARRSDDGHDIVLELYASPVKRATTGVIPGKGPPPDPPDICCMSGCPNCVWIQYADQLKRYYCDGGKKAREEIMKIENHNLRAYLLLEI